MKKLLILLTVLVCLVSLAGCLGSWLGWGARRPEVTVYETAADCPKFPLPSEWLGVEHWLEQARLGSGKVSLMGVSDNYGRFVSSLDEISSSEGVEAWYTNSHPRFTLSAQWFPRGDLLYIDYESSGAFYLESHEYCYRPDRSLYSYTYYHKRSHALAPNRRDFRVEQYFRRDGGLAGYVVEFGFAKWPSVHVWDGKRVPDWEFRDRLQAICASLSEAHGGSISH